MTDSVPIKDETCSTPFLIDGRAPRLLMISDSPDGNTGFGRVTEALLPRLQAQGWGVSLLGVNHRGDPSSLPYPVYPASALGDPLGRNRVGEVIEKVKPDLVFLHCDLWVCQEWTVQFPFPVPILCYFPVDSPGWSQGLISWCNRLHQLSGQLQAELGGRVKLSLATYTIWAQEECLRAGLDPALTPDVFPLGIDGSVFHSWEERYPDSYEGWRASARRRSDVGENDFIVLSANRNQVRKRIDTTIQGYVRFVAKLRQRLGSPLPMPPRLWLNMAPHEPESGFDTRLIYNRECARYGLDPEETGLVYTSEDFHNYNCLSRSELAQLYNFVDVSLSTTAAEGWGLTYTEAGACGVPQILPELAPLVDIWGKAAVYLPIACRSVEPSRQLEWSLTNDRHVCQALEAAYHMRLTRETRPDWNQWKKDTVLRATQSCFTWDEIARNWHVKLSDILREGSPT